MQIHRAVHSAIILSAAIFIMCLVVPAQAEMIFDASVKGAYEDNVVGLLSDKRGGYAGMPITGTGPGAGGMMALKQMGPGGGMGGSIPQDIGMQSKSDTSINIFADIGASTKITPDTSLFL